MFAVRSFTPLLLASGLVAAFPTASNVMKRSPMPMKENGKYIVERQAGEFSHSKIFAFNQTNTLPDGLIASNYDVGNPPYQTNYSPSNAVVRDGYLELIVPGGQGSGGISSGQVEMTESNILYASVRTVAILSQPAGVCNGMFFYKNDEQEIDIEWLSDPSSQSNHGTPQLWFTNQDANQDGKSTNTHMDPPSNSFNTEHEYRIDWTEGSVAFFIDGVQKWQTTEDVPTEPGSWIWNNWANGDKGWTAGPPTEDAIFKIKEIQMYYNTA